MSTTRTTTDIAASSSRRPSAPAILVDFKNFLTNAVSRKSSYGVSSSTHDIPEDPVHLIALKEHSPSLILAEDTQSKEPPQFPPATTTSERLEPPSLHQITKKNWKKTIFDINSSSNPSLASSTTSICVPPNASSTLSAAKSRFVVNRVGDEILLSKENCQPQQQLQQFSSLSKIKSLSTGSVNQKSSSCKTFSSQQQTSDSFNPSAVKSSIEVQEQQPTRNTDHSSSTAVVTKPRLFQKRQRDIVQDDDSEEGADEDLYIRRHTIADMTVAAYGMVICGGTDDLQHRYRGRIEKVKFGVPINEAFVHDIPATLLVLLLKVNKEGPLKKDIWRAPGNQAQVRKLSHIMQHGRLVNISNISVYTAASVIKKFLSKLPGGIFGSENEQELFGIVQQPDNEQQRSVFCRVICSLSVPSQHLLVLLFGTFRIISDSADTFGTRMTPDAIGISVAPSLFHTCIHDGQRAKLEDVMRFKLASQVISKIIQGFGYTNLFPRECYEFYARITGRTLRVNDMPMFTFQYPSNASKRNSATLTSMISNITAACVAAVRSYSLETLNHEKQPSITPSKVTVSSVRRGGSLKNPLPKAAVFSHKKNRLSTPPNQIYSIYDKKENVGTDDSGKKVIAIDESDLPPDYSPDPPPIDENDVDEEDERVVDENTPIRNYHQHRHPSILRAIDDLELRESASCNF